MRREERVGRDTETWAFDVFGEEFARAIEDLGADLRRHEQLDWILLHWLLLDRELAAGGTPAQRYAARPELSAADREIAVRIAAARPGIQRVVACEPGSWLELEDVRCGERRRVRSATVSREAVVWDLLVARVMPGPASASLWGPVALFAPGEEDELLDELGRLSGGERVEVALRRHWRELVTFRPPSRDRVPKTLTVEGDPLIGGHAAWWIDDDEIAFDLLATILEYEGEGDDRADVFEWLIPRAEALTRRPTRGDGALYLEATFPDHPGMVSVATFRLYADALVLSTYSERRLDLATELIARRLRGLAQLEERDAAPIGRAHPPAAQTAPAPLPPAVTEQYLSEWLNTPLECLDGLTPRVAARRPDHRGELERLLRGIENRAARARARGEPWPQVEFVRHELGHGDAELAA